MMFPAEMLVDYVRVYQREGSVNVGCDPTAYPTVDYINNHPQAYQGMLFLQCVVGIIIIIVLVCRYQLNVDMEKTTEPAGVFRVFIFAPHHCC